MNDRTEWLKARRSGIGGSDIAAILGLSPWATPLDDLPVSVEMQRAVALDEQADAGLPQDNPLTNDMTVDADTGEIVAAPQEPPEPQAAADSAPLTREQQTFADALGDD